MIVRDSDQLDGTFMPAFCTEVTVTEPIIHYSCGNGRHTTYLVILESNDVCFSQPRSVVRRRFSEFASLQRLLKASQPTVEPPRLHSYSLFHDRFNHEFIMQRRQHLQTFMQRVIAEPLYLSNKALHLFLQTCLPMREIRAQVTGISPIIPIEESDFHSFTSDSSTSTASADSGCRSCDSLHTSNSDEKCACLLSTNHEAFVASVPFLPCSSDTHIMSRKLTVPKDLHHPVEKLTATSSDYSSLLDVPEPACHSAASSNLI